MTSYLSKIKNLGEKDVSSKLEDSRFRLDDLARYGMDGKVTAMAFDPVQSLLAVGTDTGHVHVFGQHNVEVVFKPGASAPVTHLAFNKEIYLVCVDSHSNVCVVNLESESILYQYPAPGRITTVECDPSLDWLFIGLENGQVIVYDIDRGILSPFRIGNLQKSILPKNRLSPVLSIAMHPRDISTILICYQECAVLFSLARSEILLTFKYDLPAGAPGGDTDQLMQRKARSPPFLQAVWHPHGHHILTTHVDGSLVFWDATEGVLLQARTVMEVNVNMPSSLKNSPPDKERRSPIVKVCWNSTNNPEDTSIIVAGGDIDLGIARGLTMLDFGPTPEYSITSYQAMGNHYASPRRHKIYPLPEDSVLTDFIMLPRVSPYYAGCHDPSHMVVLMLSSELATIDYRTGDIVTDPAMLPPALGWINPYVTSLSVTTVPRIQWVGMMAATPEKPSIFLGGAPARRHLRTFATRTALTTGHSNGTVKMWDASHGELEDARVIEVSMQHALDRQVQLAVRHISFASLVGELSVATDNEIVFFDFKKNRRYGNASSKIEGALAALSIGTQGLKDVSSRAPFDLKEGFLPQTMLHSADLHDGQSSSISAIFHSDIGFVIVAYKSGRLVVVDRRGPAIIYNEMLVAASSGGLGSFRRRSVQAGSGAGTEHALCLELGIYALHDEAYSSIVLSAGTSLGNVHTLRIVPKQGGSYGVEPVGVFNVAPDPIIKLQSINMARGSLATATPQDMSLLPQGIVIPGALFASTATEARIFDQPHSKITHKRLNFVCLAVGLSYVREGESMTATFLTDTGKFKVMAVPSLRDMASEDCPVPVSLNYSKETVIASTGDVVVRQSLTRAALVRLWGRGVRYDDIPKDALYDALKALPPRPTISTLQWVKGKQYISQADLDLLIGGNRRPKSKAMIEQEKAQEEQRRRIKKTSTNASSSSFFSSHSNSSRDFDRPYGDNNTASRGAGGIQGTIDSWEQSAAETMNSFGDMVKDMKTNALKASFKAKFM